ncbi:hypothetical protein WJX73_001678 [Symbiochloris irregularis]|uniref:Pentatricopeptide repeat-containing protein n=1 Tax=Symbiochloris irregularis TaxID=706552 RepID=A0AAW1NM95_9CHLO
MARQPQDATPKIQPAQRLAAKAVAAPSVESSSKAEGSDAEIALLQRSLSTSQRQQNGYAQASPQFVVIDETSSERKPFHRRLNMAARLGDTSETEAVLQQMEDAGLPPGPCAYHSLIFSYVRAGQAEAALQAVRREWNAGLRPLSESYCVVITAFVEADADDVAKAVLDSMLRTGLDPRPGWLALTKACIRAELSVPAWQHIEEGQRQGWAPDAELCEMLIEVICRVKSRLDRGLEFVRDDMPAMGITPTISHANALVRAYAVMDRPFATWWPLSLVMDGTLGPLCRPNTDTFNAVMQGIVHHKRITADHGQDNPFGDDMELIKAEALTRGCKPNKLMHALYCEAYLLFGREMEAMEAFKDMTKLAREGAATELLSPEVLVQLLLINARDLRPFNIRTILEAMRSDLRELPETALQLMTDKNLTMLSCWVNSWLGAQRMKRRMPGKIDVTSVAQPLTQREIDGEVIMTSLELGAVVEAADPNKPLPLSRLSNKAMIAELELRNLSTEGTRMQLYRRVQAARLSPPNLLLAGLRKQQQAREAKEERNRERVLERSKNQGKERRYKWRWSRVSDGEERADSVREEVTSMRVLPTTQQKSRQMSAAATSRFDDEAIDMRKMKAVGRGALSTSEMSALEGDDEDDDDETAVAVVDPFVVSLESDIEPLGRSLYEPKSFWPEGTGAARLGLELCEHAIALGQGPSFEDVCQLLLAADEENDAETAFAIAMMLGDLESQAQDHCWLFTSCWGVCMAEDRMDLAEAIAEVMEDVSMPLEDVVSTLRLQ